MCPHQTLLFGGRTYLGLLLEGHGAPSDFRTWSAFSADRVLNRMSTMSQIKASLQGNLVAKLVRCGGESKQKGFE
jgi:hypothetical protein